MIVIEKNKGTKIEYAVNDTKVTFGDDEFTLNLAKYERDEEVRIDICRDDKKILSTGVSKYFVANIIIPARAHDETGAVLPFDMERVTLVLWTLIENGVEV
jgi:hypothetical protein